MEPKYYAFRRWLDTLIIIWEYDWIPRVILLAKLPFGSWLNASLLHVATAKNNKNVQKYRKEINSNSLIPCLPKNQVKNIKQISNKVSVLPKYHKKFNRFGIFLGVFTWVFPWNSSHKSSRSSPSPEKHPRSSPSRKDDALFLVALGSSCGCSVWGLWPCDVEGFRRWRGWTGDGSLEYSELTIDVDVGVYGCWTKNRGETPQIIRFDRVFHYFHHPFWGTPIFGNTHIRMELPMFKSILIPRKTIPL